MLALFLFYYSQYFYTLKKRVQKIKALIFKYYADLHCILPTFTSVIKIQTGGSLCNLLTGSSTVEWTVGPHTFREIGLLTLKQSHQSSVWGEVLYICQQNKLCRVFFQTFQTTDRSVCPRQTTVLCLTEMSAGIYMNYLSLVSLFNVRPRVIDIIYRRLTL